MNRYETSQLDIRDIRCSMGSKYAENVQQDVAEFLTDFHPRSMLLQKVVLHKLKIIKKCNKCNRIEHLEIIDNFIAPLILPAFMSINYNDAHSLNWRNLFDSNY